MTHTINGSPWQLSRHVFVYTATWTTPEGFTFRANFSPEWGTLKPVADVKVDEIMRNEGIELMPLQEEEKKKGKETMNGEDNDQRSLISSADNSAQVR